MRDIRIGSLPPVALTYRYLESGAYVDCYFTDVARSISLAEFVEAFYTTGLFRLERWILRALVARPSTDAEARQFARGERDDFAAWSVEARAPNQLLARDFMGRTLSWFMVAASEGAPWNRLYFGSVVIPIRDPKTGRLGLGPVHSRLMGFHKVYSRMLLWAAARNLTAAYR